MPRRIVLISLVAGVALLALVDATPYAQGASRETPSPSLDEKLSAAIARGDVPGLVVMAATGIAWSTAASSAKRRSATNVR
jgi:hypothetical protein